MEDKLEYQEDFTATVLKEDVNYKIKAVLELHSAEYGWVAGEPTVVPVDDRYVRVTIPLKKYAKEKTR